MKIINPTHLQHPSLLRRLSEVQEEREPPADEKRAAVAGPLRELLGPLVQPALQNENKKNAEKRQEDESHRPQRTIDQKVPQR